MGRRSDFKKKQYRKTPAGGRTVTVKESNLLLPFLFELLNQQSKSSVKAMLKHGQISLNGRVTTQFDTPVNAGDQVDINYGRGKVEFNHPLLRIVWEDELLIVVDKKEGLLSAGNSKVKERTAFSLLSDYLKKNDPRSRLFLLNPLDKETSGLMLFARNKGVQQYYLDNWNDVITYRRFVGVVKGVPEKESGILTSGTEGEEDAKVFITSASDSRRTFVRYKVLKTNQENTLVEFIQEGGKKNIIKEQMFLMGNPVFGSEPDEAGRALLGRAAIHANQLHFKYSETGEELRFESSWPGIFNNLIAKIKK